MIKSSAQSLCGFPWLTGWKTDIMHYEDWGGQRALIFSRCAHVKIWSWRRLANVHLALELRPGLPSAALGGT